MLSENMAKLALYAAILPKFKQIKGNRGGRKRSW